MTIDKENIVINKYKVTLTSLDPVWVTVLGYDEMSARDKIIERYGKDVENIELDGEETAFILKSEF